MRDTQEEIYNYAYDLFEEKEYSEAINILEKFISKHNYFIDAFILLANCFVEINHFTDAARVLLNAEKINSKNPIIKYNLGYSLLCMGRVSDSINYFKEALELNPPEEIKEMSKRMLTERKFFEEKMENNYKISLAEEFECHDIFLEARQLLYSGRENEAINLYFKIIEKKPEHSETLHNIGAAYFKLGQFEKAIEFFDKSKKNDLLFLSNMAISNYKLGNKQKTKEYIELIRNSNEIPFTRDAVRILTILIELNENSLAKKITTDCIKKLQHPQLEFIYGVLLAKEGEFELAKNVFFSLKDYSDVCINYYKATEKLIKGDILNYDFNPEIICDDIQVI